MTVFNYFLRCVWRMKASVLMYVAIFLAISVVIELGNRRQANTTFEEVPVTIAVVGAPEDEWAQAFVSYLQRNNHVTMVTYSEEELREQLFIGSYDAGIVLSPQFKERLLAGQPAVRFVADEQIASGLLEVRVNAFLIFANAALQEGHWTPEQFLNVMAQKATVALHLDSGEIQASPLVIWASRFFSALVYVLICIFIMIFGLLLSAFQRKEVLQRQNVSPLSSWQRQISLFAGVVLVAFLIASLMIASSLLFKPALLQESVFVKHLIVTYAFSLSITAAAFLFANIIGPRSTAYNTLANGLGLGLSFLSGVFIPMEYLPESMLSIMRFFPAYHVAKANATLSAEWATYQTEVGILLLFAALYFVLALCVARAKSGRILMAKTA